MLELVKLGKTRENVIGIDNNNNNTDVKFKRGGYTRIGLTSSKFQGSLSSSLFREPPAGSSGMTANRPRCMGGDAGLGWDIRWNRPRVVSRGGRSSAAVVLVLVFSTRNRRPAAVDDVSVVTSSIASSLPTFLQANCFVISLKGHQIYYNQKMQNARNA